MNKEYPTLSFSSLSSNNRDKMDDCIDTASISFNPSSFNNTVILGDDSRIVTSNRINLLFNLDMRRWYFGWRCGFFRR